MPDGMPDEVTRGAGLCYPFPMGGLAPILYAALFLQLGSTPVGQRANNGAAGPLSISAEVHRFETAFLHLPLERAALRWLLVFDLKTLEARAARPAEGVDDSTPVMILHLWATWCGPCKEELGIWRKLGPRLVEENHGRVRIVYVALQKDLEGMTDFVSQIAGGFPGERLYLDRDENLSKNLRQAVPNEQLPLPMTLWLDENRIVRQALVGPINQRRAEVIDSTARLLRLIRHQELAEDAAAHPKAGVTDR